MICERFQMVDLALLLSMIRGEYCTALCRNNAFLGDNPKDCDDSGLFKVSFAIAMGAKRIKEFYPGWSKSDCTVKARAQFLYGINAYTEPMRLEGQTFSASQYADLNVRSGTKNKKYLRTLIAKHDQKAFAYIRSELTAGTSVAEAAAKFVASSGIVKPTADGRADLRSLTDALAAKFMNSELAKVGELKELPAAPGSLSPRELRKERRHRREEDRKALLKIERMKIAGPTQEANSQDDLKAFRAAQADLRAMDKAAEGRELARRNSDITTHLHSWEANLYAATSWSVKETEQAEAKRLADEAEEREVAEWIASEEAKEQIARQRNEQKAATAARIARRKANREKAVEARSQSDLTVRDMSIAAIQQGREAIEAEKQEQRKLESAALTTYDPTYVSELSGHDYEDYWRKLLLKRGVIADWVGLKGNDGWADLVFTHRGRRYLVQAKRQSSVVTTRVIGETHAGMVLHKCVAGWVVTNSSFTKPARERAALFGIDLVYGDPTKFLDAFFFEERAA